MIKIVDTASIIYNSKNLDISNVVKAIESLLDSEFEIENNKYIFRNIKIPEHRYINYVSVTELKRNTRITIAFSYSKFENNGSNYLVCTRERTIRDVHTRVLKLFRYFTGKTLKYEDLEVYTLDISNQLSVENVKSYYSVQDIIYRALKLSEPNGRLYFDIDKNRRKQLDGLDFRERGKKRREASSYFKIYNKRKEEEDTGKNTAGHVTALRGELTLKGVQLKKWNLSTLAGINKQNLDRVLRDALAVPIIAGINEELNFSLNHLKKVFKKSGTKRIRENILINEFHIFDVSILDGVLTPEILGVSLRQCQKHKKQIIELLETNANGGEIKKTYSGNFERLKKLLKKIAKVDIKTEITKDEVKITWENQNLQEK